MVTEMVQLRDIGWSMSKISDHLGVSKMSVSRSLRDQPEHQLGR